MASSTPQLTSPRRPDAAERRRLVLQASEAVTETERVEVDPVSWPVAAVVGGLATAAVGWLVVTGLVVCGWLMGDDAELSSALELGTRLWLLACGVPVPVAGLDVSLVPWGVTVLSAALLWRFGGYAVRRVTDRSSGPLAVALVVTTAHTLPVLATAVFLGEPWRAPGRWAAVVLVLLVAAWGGAARRSGRAIGSSWPAPLRGLPRAVAAAQGVLLLAGAAVLALALVAGWDRVVALGSALQAGSFGTALLVVVQLALLPNALVWSGSYALGAGFSLGSGSVVAPAATSLGVLPGLPLLGALPAAGPGSTLQLWWLVSGAVAGAVAALLALRGAPVRRVDATTLLGGLAGVAAALVFTGLAWTTSGDLGSLRLTGLGPRLLPLLVMSSTTLGLSGMLTGAVVGVVRHLRGPAPDDADALGPEAPDGEATEVIGDAEATEVLEAR
ncbi:cell division protein PerM [Microlunatus flavus]|uniref:Integral membrane protein n=1 Tax=Microlunatus flavus TaxID=1036181 RepID=A0A1H9MAJ1_9ACTN|nr:DUF6350 family protein [Microlunatus flavus]SER20477.1 hypothetical protein SAMN05421756_11019 [Microlunatus flavus]